MLGDQSDMPKRIKLRRYILLLYSVAFAIGTTTHLQDIFQHGWHTYTFEPIWLEHYWSSLAIFDPLAIVLLWTRIRAGLVTALAIMVSDVMINSYALYVLEIDMSLPHLQLQTVFLGFVMGSLPFLWSKKLITQ